MKKYTERLIDEKIGRKLKSTGGKVYHYRDSSGLEIEATVNLRKLLTRLAPEKAAQCTSLNVVIAGSSSYTRKDINIISLGHLFVN